ncbi:MAG TPA: stage II sporulation protein M, partial [Polyangiaceae bacterium]|nr:stage II sporulation protein M [Polyangiaceae bacterium]
MNAVALAQAREASWTELEAIVKLAERRGASRLEPASIDALLHLYRSASADLARLRALDADPAVLLRLNRLVQRAHALVYRSPKKSVSLAAFYARDFPRLFRETARYTAWSFGISVVFFALAHVAVRTRPELVADLLGGGLQEFSAEHRSGDIQERFQMVPSPLLSALVTTNNIGVALRAFAFGITFGLGTFYVLAVNGAMLGGFSGAYSQAGLSRELWATLLPHGALELSAIVVAGGAGLLLGGSLVWPGRRSRLEALRDEAPRAAQLAAGLAPAFVVAGTFEGFVTPSHALPAALKVSLGALAAA